MKIIDLYNMVANNEKLPKKIIYKNCIFENRSVIDYWCKEAKICLDELIFMQNLNDEVETIEEENKIPEKLGYQDNADGTFYLNRKKYNSEPIKILSKKINDIIDYLDYLKSKGGE